MHWVNNSSTCARGRVTKKAARELPSSLKKDDIDPTLYRWETHRRGGALECPFRIDALNWRAKPHCYSENGSHEFLMLPTCVLGTGPDVRARGSTHMAAHSSIEGYGTPLDVH